MTRAAPRWTQQALPPYGHHAVLLTHSRPPLHSVAELGKKDSAGVLDGEERGRRAWWWRGAQGEGGPGEEVSEGGGFAAIWPKHGRPCVGQFPRRTDRVPPRATPCEGGRAAAARKQTAGRSGARRVLQDVFAARCSAGGTPRLRSAGVAGCA
jgi:hypothetical protein